MMRPHIDVPVGYFIEHISRLGATEVESDMDSHIALAPYPYQIDSTLATSQRVFIHVHRLRALKESSIYLVCRPLLSSVLSASELPRQFKFFPGWIQDVNVTGGSSGMGKCDGDHRR